MIDAALKERIEDIASATVSAAQPVSGGDFATAYQVDLDDGRTLFAKTHPNPPPGFFTTEAAGLEWLAEPGVANVARVVGVTDDAPACLVLDWVDVGGRRSEEGESELGRSLAQLHQAGAPAFGRQDGRTTGSLALPNTPCDTWSEFYSDRRLLPLVKIAADRQALGQRTLDAVLDVADRLAEFGAANEPPARLHGDLWAGNRVVDTDGNSWLIDPAAHGGHREFDLAMMQLFGGFGESCFSAYDDAFPLASGWRSRVGLHQLAPLIVHAIKFGGGYGAAVDDALAALA